MAAANKERNKEVLEWMEEVAAEVWKQRYGDRRTWNIKDPMEFEVASSDGEE